MAHDQPSQADGEPQDAPDPPIALDDFASSEIPDLESSWVDSGDGNAHQLTALSEENQLQDIAQPPVAHHHCAACTDPACEGAGSTAAEVGSHDTSVGLDFHTVRNKTPTELVLQEHASAATLQDVPSSEPIGPDLFQRLSPEIRDMIFALVYAGSNLFAGVQGSCTRDFGGRLAEHKETRTESAVLVRAIPGTVKGTRGTRGRSGHYLRPFKPDHNYLYETEQLEPEAPVLSSVNGLLFVNKQTYLEALPHLYRNTTFFFEDWKDTQNFATTIGHDSLRLIRAVEVFFDQGRDDTTDIRWFNYIVAYMPNIEHLTISFWSFGPISLESDEWDGSAKRCDEFEKALLQFARLKFVRQIDVKILEESGEADEYEVADHLQETKKAVEEMIRTGDRGILDRAREAELRGLGDFAEDILESISETVDRSGLSKEWWLKRLAL